MRISKFLLLVMPIVLLSCKENKSPLLDELNNKYNLTTSEELKDPVYASQIESFYDNGIEGFFNGQSDIKIYYKIFKQDKTDKAILISSGRTEAAIKYKELIYDLFNNGYSIYIHDHRGQGLSQRLVENPDMGYIDNFQYYVDDMKYFYDNYIQDSTYTKIYLLAHSMGGAIGMTYLEQNPKDFNAAAFSSPMFGLKPTICSIVKLVDKEEPKFAVGQSEYNDSNLEFENNTLTGSIIRFNRMIKAYQEVPKARLGGATYSWLHHSCKQFGYLFDNIDKIQTPFVLFSAENEDIVNPAAHKRFFNVAKKIGKECEYYQIKDAEHELLIEKDVLRIQTLNKIIDFYSNN
ncbi:alpha/beta fold hydrolase [Winogradskyella sp. HB-48]|uniref:alpha/beta fold hydrolase n=1 Tax=Winogradskyella sp. HB-48 TaxID=3416808 RepID=UPI003CF4FC73